MTQTDDPSDIDALVKPPGDPLKPHQAPPAGISAPAAQGGVNHLAMNCVVPGLGSLMRGQKSLGAAQLGLFVLGVIFFFSGHWLMGPLLAFSGWAWSVASGIGFLREPRPEWK